MSPTPPIELGYNRFSWRSDEQHGPIEFAPCERAPFVGFDHTHTGVSDQFGREAVLEEAVVHVDTACVYTCG